MADRTGQQIGNYRLVRLLGRGAFAEVYLGEHRYLKSYAALKVLRTSVKDEDLERLLSEAQTLVHLIHPNVVRVLEFVVERGTPVLIMDYAPGGTAREHYTRGSCLSLATTASYIKQIAAALQYAHNANIIHRDVKPENILIGSGQHILLSDFGIALLAPSPELLSTQDMAGTLPYTAPEQLRGRAVFESDQYALGVVAYEWLCGRRPFEGSSWEIMNAHVHAAPPPLRVKYPELPAEVESVVLRALAKEPQERFVSVQAFAHALERASSASKLDDFDQSEVTATLRASSDTPFATFSDKTPRSVFLSASPADDAFAARLEADLEARGVPIVRGRDTSDSYPEEAVRQAIRASDIALVVISPGTRSSRKVQEQLRITGMYDRQLVFVWAAGDELATLLPEAWGKSAVVDLVDAREARYQLALQEIVARLSGSFSTEPVHTHTPPAGGIGAIYATLQSEPRNPYKGLRAFTHEDSTDFFGRDALIQEMAQTMQHTLASPQPGTRAARLLAVVGPSGSGKSSVVMAGLLPQLSKGLLPESEQWEYLEPMVPQKHPLESLALALASHLPARSLKTIREDLEGDSGRGLHLLATQMEKRVGAKVVLMVDQFEELFASAIPEPERQQFIDLLVTAATEPRGPVIVILTLRADFYDRPLSYPALAQLIQQYHHIVLPMEIQDLRAIIEQPAALPDVQLTFEGNLVGDMLFDAQGQAGALPLLEFTLDQLFQRREGHWLTLQAYQQIGGVKGALAKQAESTYASLPSAEHRRLARALFLRLIDPGVTEQDTTRRRAALSELSLADPEQTKIMREAVDAFVAARLLITNVIEGTTTIEVSHEALIREWARLAEWLQEARLDIPLQQAISGDAAEWERRGRPEDRIYSGTELAEAQAWAERNVPSVEELTFLKASVAEYERKEKLEQSRQAREMKLQRRVVSRQRILIAALSIFSAIVIVLGSVAGFSFLQAQAQQKQAEMEAQIALTQALSAASRALAANADIALSQHQLDLALLLSVKANQTANTYEARDSLLSALEDSPQIVTMLRSGAQNPLGSLDFGSDGSTLIAADNSNVYVWNTKTEKYRALYPQKGDYIGGVALSPNGQILATSSAAGVWLWNSQTLSQPVQLEGSIVTPPAGFQPQTELVFSPDGKFVISARCSQYGSASVIPPICLRTRISVWNVQTQQRTGTPETISAGVISSAFSQDGGIFASNSGTSIQLWSVATGQALGSPFTGIPGSITTVAISPDDKILAAGSNSGTVQLWKIASRQPITPAFTGHSDSIMRIAFSPKGGMLASSSKDGTVRLWNEGSPQSIATLRGDAQEKWGIAFSPDGQTLASGSWDGTIILWNTVANSVIRRQLATTPVLQSPVFSPDGTLVYTGSSDGRIFIQNVKTGASLTPLVTTGYPLLQPNIQGNDTRTIESLALSGDTLAAGRLDGTIILWDIKTGKPIGAFGKPNLLFTIALSSDGRILAASDGGNTITLWDVAKRSILHTLHYQADNQFSTLPIALSPDGKLLAVGTCGKMQNGGCVQGQIQLWNVQTGKLDGQQLFGHHSAISALAFSPDGSILASSSSDGIILWNVTTRKPSSQILALANAADYYSNLLFSPNGKILASYSGLGSPFNFVLWDVTRLEPVAHALQEGDTYQGNIAFSPDGQQIASVSVLFSSPYEGIFNLWDITLPSWQKDACSIANRNLTRSEWNQYVKNEAYSKVCPDLAI